MSKTKLIKIVVEVDGQEVEITEEMFKKNVWYYATEHKFGVDVEVVLAVQVDDKVHKLKLI